MKNLSINKLFNFKNKIIIISGSSGLLGTSFAQLFLDMGSIVVGLDKSKNKNKNNKFYFFNADISDEKTINKILKFVFKKFKKIDVIINRAFIALKFTAKMSIIIRLILDASFASRLINFSPGFKT